MVESRRDERRAATIEEIKTLAWQQMTANGPANLSLRAIARQMRVSSAAIYRYYPNRDALLNALSLDAYRQQVSTMLAAVDTLPAEDHPGRILAAAEAYRAWALSNPVAFALIYGTPVPGSQPDWELLLPIAKQGLEIFIDLADAAVRAGAMAQAPRMSLSPTLRAQLQRLAAERGYQASAEAVYLALAGWSRAHGLLSLELIGQLGLLLANADELYRVEMLNLLAQMGCHPLETD